MKNFFRFLLPILVALIVGWLSRQVQVVPLAEWYPTLLKPALTPPDWIFPIVWGILYILMGISAGLLLTSQRPGARAALWLWALQLVLNFVWTLCFFWWQSPLAGVIVLLLLLVTVILYIVKAMRCHKAAAILMLPYALWLVFAGYLNIWIMINN